MARFVHDRVIFAGDSAHLVSPFGARGCNGGLADVDNLGWKLDLVLRGEATPDLLETYNTEAIATADENILNSTRSTDFLTPKSESSRAFRDAVLDLSRDCPFARTLVNSGRLSTAVSYPASPLNTPDGDAWAGGVPPGSPALDAPLDNGWLLERLGDRFVLLTSMPVAGLSAGIAMLDVSHLPQDAALIERFDLRDGGAYLIRPDQYVAARFRNPDARAIAQAYARATGIAA
jgi:3-(3-hydroxy-phenyl)propionate hydroxylase